LSSGEIVIDTTSLSLSITPQSASDEMAFFEYNKYRLNPEGLYIYGALRLSAPTNTSLTNGSKEIQTESSWVNYNNYTINDSPELTENLVFDNITGFEFQPTNAHISINNNTYKYNYSGDIVIPGSLMNSSEPTILPLIDIDNFELFTVNNISGAKLNVADSSNIFIYPELMSFDFSSTVSSDVFQNQPEWTGVYFDNFSLLLESKLDTIKNNISISNEMSFQNSDTPNNVSFISSDEWFIDISMAFTDQPGATFQVYDALLDSIYLKHDMNGFDDNSHLYGEIAIPAISDDYLNFKIPFENNAIGVGKILNIDDKFENLNSPLLSAATDITSSEIKLIWHKDEQAVRYSATLSDDNFTSTLPNYIDIPVENDIFLDLDNLQSNKDYWYRITSHFIDGTHSVSLTGNFKSFVTSVYEENNIELVIYPNPTHGRITVGLQDANRASVTLIDLNGKTIEISPSVLDTKRLQIDLGRLSAGTYRLLVKTSESMAIEQVVIIK
jgi:hypothetical protein